ncbi:MAG: transcriptional repressor [Treponema sp.]|nr:transcriptional repressor [Treponema sp.]
MKNTAQRKLILGAVEGLGNHPSADEVLEYLVLRRPSIGRATVYRNLSRMAQTGELLFAGNFQGRARYDQRLDRYYHCICDSCGRIFDVEGDLSDLSGRIKPTEGFDVSACNITFNGLCWECKAANSNLPREGAGTGTAD